MIRQRDVINNIRTILFRVLLFVLLASTSGCWVVSQMRNRFGPKPQCMLSPTISKTELIAHLNKNISPLISWKSSDVKVTTTTPMGIPLTISADIAVESPRNFRLTAHSLTGNEADFGSNQERSWFWVKRSPDKRVITVSHENLPHISQRMQLPFHPDWMMEALGVIPIDETDITIEEDPSDAGILQLISKQQSPSGKPIRRIIQVDTCRGYILAQSLYAEDGTLLAEATLNGYKIDKNSGIAMPHQIILHLPKFRQHLKLSIGNIDVNPEYLPQQMFQMPQISNFPVHDLASERKRYTLQ